MFKIYWSKNKKLGKILKRNTEDGKKLKLKTHILKWIEMINLYEKNKINYQKKIKCFIKPEWKRLWRFHKQMRRKCI